MKSTNFLKVKKVVSKQIRDNFSDYWIFNWLTADIFIKKQYQHDKNNSGDRVFYLIIIQFNTTCQEFTHQD